MNMKSQTLTLNRALFINRPLDSSALTPLVTLLHRFTEPGSYELFVRRDGTVVYRGAVEVVGKLRSSAEAPPPAEGAPYQINVDLATIGQTDDDCYDDGGYVLATGGVMGFYVGEGTGAYAVALTCVVGEKKETVFDSAKGLPEGDFFAVTLVRPGTYVVTNQAADARMKVAVAVPKREGYRPDQVTLVQATTGRFEPPEAVLQSGQSILFQCGVASRFVIEMIDAASGYATRDAAREGERPRYTIRKRPPPQPG